MPLHRLTVPSYTGGLPGTHDYINDPATNGDPGTAAPADNKKSSGVNQGTYFVAFSENATSSNTNRGLKALAQNTDFLDDAIHRDIGQPAVSASATPGSPLASFVITGSVFVGAPGVTNDQRTRSGMVALVDGNGQPLTVLSGGVYLAVKASLIHDGASNNVLGNNFYSNPTVNVSPSIPAGQTYRYVFYQRSNYIALDQGAFSRFNNGIANAEDLWAFARTLDVTVAKLPVNNTFVGKQIFSFPTVDQPILSSTIYNANRAQIWESQVSTAPNLFMRQYSRGAGAPGGADIVGLEITINARWDNTAVNWVADSTSVPAIKFEVLQGGAGDKIRKYVLAAPTSTFTDATFNGDKYTWYENGITTQHKSAATALIELIDDLTSAPLANHYKSLVKTTGGPGQPAMYATARGAAVSTDDNGFAFTSNAGWITGSQAWGCNPAQAATKVMTTVDGLKISRRLTPGSGFNDASWDHNITIRPSDTSPGDLEYKIGVVRTKLINPYSGMSGDNNGTPGRWIVGDAVPVGEATTIPYISCSIPNSFIFYPVSVPAGSTITRIRFSISQGAVSDNMKVEFGFRDPLAFSLIPLVPPTDNNVATVFSNAQGDKVYNMTVSELVTGFSYYYLAFKSTTSCSTSTPDRIYGIQVIFTDPGFSGR